MIFADLDWIAKWLANPHVAAWWNDDVEEEVENIAAHIGSASVKPYMLEIDGRTAGYIQSYDPHAEAGHPYQDQPPGTLGIDQMIGEPDLVGLGHGPRMIMEFARLRFDEGVPRLIIDPDPDNHRAIRAYTKAGFTIFDRRTTIYGPALMMRRDLEDKTV